LVFPEQAKQAQVSQNKQNLQAWSNLNVPNTMLNQFRRWLLQDVQSMAVDWVEVYINTSSLHTERLAIRLWMVPFIIDPLQFEDFLGKSTSECSENNCVVFDLNVTNSSPEIRNVIGADLEWVPLGNQTQKFKTPPRPKHEDVLLLRLHPGQQVSVRMYLVKGTGRTHAKWKSVNAHYYSSAPNRAPFTFTVELVGGLTFEHLQAQVAARFKSDPLSLPTVSYQ